MRNRQIAAAIGAAVLSLLLGSVQSVARPPAPEPYFEPARFNAVYVPPTVAPTPAPVVLPEIIVDPDRRAQPRSERPTPKAKPKAKSIAKPIRPGWPIKSRRCYVSQWSNGPDHIAIDIAGCSGAPVIPMRNGRVVFAGWRNNGGGYQVWVSHGNGLYSTYNHLRREVTYRGERVTGGKEVIGYVGSSGNSTGPHLHFEVWRGYPWRGYPVNPWPYINQGTYLPPRYR